MMATPHSQFCDLPVNDIKACLLEEMTQIGQPPLIGPAPLLVH
jgi:hypothetical protein